MKACHRAILMAGVRSISNSRVTWKECDNFFKYNRDHVEIRVAVVQGFL